MALTQGATRYQAPSECIAMWGGFVQNVDEIDKQANLELKKRLEAKKAEDEKVATAASSQVVPAIPKDEWRPVIIDDKCSRFTMKAKKAEDPKGVATASSQVLQAIPKDEWRPVIIDDEKCSRFTMKAKASDKIKSAAKVDFTKNDGNNDNLFTQDNSTIKVKLPVNTQPPRESITTAGSSDYLFAQEGPIIVKIPGMTLQSSIKPSYMISKATAVLSPLAPPFTPSTWSVTPTVNMPNKVDSPEVKPANLPSTTSDTSGLGISFLPSTETSQAPTKMATIVKKEEGSENLWLTATEKKAKEMGKDSKDAQRMIEEERENMWLTAAEIKAKELSKQAKEKETKVKEESDSMWLTAARMESMELAKQSVKDKEAEAKGKSENAWSMTAEAKNTHDNAWMSAAHDNPWLSASRPQAKNTCDNAWLSASQPEAKNAAEALDDSTDGGTIAASTPPTSHDSDNESNIGKVLPKVSKWSLTRFTRGTTQLSGDLEANSSPEQTYVTQTTPVVDHWGKPLSKTLLRDGVAIGASAAAMGDESKGHAMMAKMGWTPGTALGSSATGRLEPVVQIAKLTKRGLGAVKATGAQISDTKTAAWAAWGEASNPVYMSKEGAEEWGQTENENAMSPEEIDREYGLRSPEELERAMQQRKERRKQEKAAKNYLKKAAKIETAIANGDEAALLKLRGGRGQKFRGNGIQQRQLQVARSQEVGPEPGSPDML